MSKEHREKLANQNGGHNKVIAELREIVELKALKERACLECGETVYGLLVEAFHQFKR
jgi:hypothetical protein